MARIGVNVDGIQREDEVEPRLLLVHWLRDKIGLVGTPMGCDTSNCGACTVLLDSRSVKSCSVLAVQVDDSTITTIQGLAGAGPKGAWHPVQTAFKECHGLQCGYCTPGMVLAAVDLLSENPNPTDWIIRCADRFLPCPARVFTVFTNTTEVGEVPEPSMCAECCDPCRPPTSIPSRRVPSSVPTASSNTRSSSRPPTCQLGWTETLVTDREITGHGHDRSCVPLH